MDAKLMGESLAYTSLSVKLRHADASAIYLDSISKTYGAFTAMSKDHFTVHAGFISH